MLRLVGILFLVVGAVAGALGGHFGGDALLGWGGNLGALFLFWSLMQLMVTREGFGVLSELLAVDTLGKAVILLAGGLAIGLIGAGYVYLSALAMLPASSLISVLILWAALDFFMGNQMGWVRLRERMAEDPRPKLALLIGIGIVDVLLISLVQGEWGYLPPVITILVLAAAAYGIDRLFSRSRIWAVARHMVAEGVRMKVVLVFIVLLLILLPVIPLTVEGDGLTLTSRVQSFFAYALGAVSFLLSLLTVFMACGALSNELRDRHIFMVASKPVPRWQFFFGKWLGVAMLNAGLLLLSGATIWGFSTYMRTLPTSVPDDKEQLVHEVLTVRYAMKVKKPDFEPLVEERLRQLNEEGRLDDAPVAEARRTVLKELQQQFQSHGPGVTRTYAFEGLIVDRESNKFLQVELKPVAPGGSFDKKFQIRYQFGDPDQLETITEPRDTELLVERVNTLVCPVQAVNDQGTLYFKMRSLDPMHTMIFEGEESMQLLFGLGTFHWNLFRALAIIWCKLSFLALLGLFWSSWVSYPVACMACFLLLIGSWGAGFLFEAVDAAETMSAADVASYTLTLAAVLIGVILAGCGLAAFVWESGEETRERMAQLAALLLFGGVGIVIGSLVLNPAAFLLILNRDIPILLLWVLPDFAQFDPVGNVVSGRVVTLMWVIQAIIKLLILRGLLLGVAGAVIFSKREVAEVSV